MLLKDIIKIFENKYPKNLAYDWDNIGLIIGDSQRDIRKILVALEATEEVVDEAIEKDVDLVITHHPFLFKGLKRVTKDTPKGNCIYKLIKNDIAVYSSHTNFDIAYDGLNDEICSMLELENIKILDKTKADKMYKIVVYVPLSHEDKVREALGLSGAGHIGNYSNCTFNTKGIGTFMPLENTNPYIGSKGNLEKVQEVRIETICSENILSNVISKMIDAHPYEEVAYDIYELRNEGMKYGLGRIGDSKENMTLGVFAQYVKEKLDISDLRIVGSPNKEIKKVAVVSGSGSSMIHNAYSMKADVLITGDVKYHEAQEALELGICLIDAGHFGSEKIFVDIASRYLEANLKNVEIIRSDIYINPFVTI
ncbi:Nif3-like dinuclear metal center hexameric protein [Alkalithermobacter paradoxus]|uniref:GTP cyclohydrolase 1 type 2 homolog n=1 Tax=Alkalithermobacter paradoxus TaxID=29349 RepID=A0A1V4IAU3_9FIRM|nr:putative GTP cyclohydrolase 1 type 2 [[Clostridium] thermoalcaliphilum]